MLSKKLLSVLVAGLMLCSFSTSAFAELFSISAGVPMTYTFNESGTESDGTSGLLMHVKMPIMLGLGIENYETKIKDTVDQKVSHTIYDMFYQFPIPFINITAGVGFGINETSCTGCDVSQGNVVQYYAQLGIPIMVVDIHVSHHTIYSKATDNNTDKDVNYGGSLTAIGVSVGF